MKSFNEVDQKLMAKMVEKYAENVPTCRQDFSEDVFENQRKTTRTPENRPKRTNISFTTTTQQPKLKYHNK